MCPRCSLRGPWAPHLAYLASKTEKDRKKYSKWCPKWRPFRHFELPLGHLGPLLEGPGVKIWCPRSILCTLLKHRFLLVFLLVFGGLGSPVELQMVASAPLWGPCGGLSVIFGCKKCCIEFWSPKMIPVPRLRWVEAKGRRQRRGSAEGGEASPPSYARFCAYSLARPATSDEVRRIVLSFAPSAAAVWHCDHVRIPCESNSVRHSVFS